MKKKIASMPINLLFLYKKEMSGAVLLFINKIEREREARAKYYRRESPFFFFFSFFAE